MVQQTQIIIKEEFIKRLVQGGQRQASSESRNNVTYLDMGKLQLLAMFLISNFLLSKYDETVPRIHVSHRYVSSFKLDWLETELRDPLQT